MSEDAIRTEAAAVLGIEPAATVRGSAALPAWWDVDGLASASVATFADAVAVLLAEAGPRPGAVVDRGRVATWFRQALAPVGWTLPSPWDPIASDYRAADGWIRLHTNAPHHRAAAIRVLGVPERRDAVAAAVADRSADALESAVVDAGGAAAALRDAEAWSAHPQGRAAAAEPLIARTVTDPSLGADLRPTPGRPLAGIRVLDLTRVLAGPVATRALAGLGATVLRIDPPGWDEPAVVPDMTLGKRCARLDARTAAGRAMLLVLLREADVLVHGYRRDALDGIGLDERTRRGVRPGLVEVALTAYGWSGPWAGRRGFDSLVQMSAGIAERGMRASGADRPVPLPVQALDHATGWLMAAAAVAGLRDRLRDGAGSTARLSLARTAASLAPTEPHASAAPPPVEAGTRLDTPWGAAELAPPPVEIVGAPLRFDDGPAPLGSGDPEWA